MKKRIMTMLISAMCLSTVPMNSVIIANAADTNAVSVAGDVNADGEFNIADAVMLQKWMLGNSDEELANWKAADLCSDNMLDGFDFILMKKALIEKMSGSPELDNPEVHEILFGYSDSASQGKESPSSSIKIAMKCKAFCPVDETLNVDVARLGLDEPQGYGDNTFIYNYSVSSYTDENMNRVEDTRLIVNGVSGSYVKEYAGEDRDIFNVGREYDDYETYHHETTTLDFCNYPVGTSGSITFIFKAVFLNEDGTLPEHPSTSGCGQTLFFYVGEDGAGISNTSVEDAEKAYQEKGCGEVTPADTYTGRWHGKNISFELYKALKNPDSETIPVKVTLTDKGADNFIYHGRTIKEYINDTMGEDITKLENLLYRGGQLKYGEALYLSPPDSIEWKWTKDTYEGDIEYFGEELLSKYIVDGEFLQEQLQADLVALKKYYQDALDEAVEAFNQVRAEETIAVLEAQGIRSKQIADTYDIVMYVNAAELEELSLENASYFSIAFEEQTIF